MNRTSIHLNFLKWSWRFFVCLAAVIVLTLSTGMFSCVNAQTVDVGIPVEEHPELFFKRSMPTHGNGKLIVFLIEFPDYKNENPVATREYYDKLYFSGGVETYWGNETVAVWSIGICMLTVIGCRFLKRQ